MNKSSENFIREYRNISINDSINFDNIGNLSRMSRRSLRSSVDSLNLSSNNLINKMKISTNIPKYSKPKIHLIPSLHNDKLLLNNNSKISNYK